MQGCSGFNSVLWVPRYWPALGGTEFHTRRLAHELCRYHPVSVITHCNHSPGQYALPQEVALTETSHLLDGETTIALIGAEERYKRLLFTLGSHYETQPLIRTLYQQGFNRALQKTVKSKIQGADLVHFVYNGLTDAASLAQQMCASLNIPFVLTPNVLDTESNHNAWNSRRFLNLYDKADQIIALTTHEADWLMAQGAAGEKISVVPYGPILDTGQANTHGIMDEATANVLKERYVLYLGRMVAEKGYPLLIDAFRQLCSEREDITLVVVGNEEQEMVDQLTLLNDELGDSRAVFINKPSQVVKTQLIKNALALCVPSSVESLGGVYIEAMACGVPVVALDLPVIRCVIEHGHDGLLTDNSVESVKSALLWLIDNPVEAQEMGLAGQAKAESRFHWSTVTEQILQVYQSASISRSNPVAGASRHS